MFEKIRLFLAKHNIGRNVIADVGCGSGQGTFEWTSHFDKCVGTDISPAQISYASDKLKETPDVSNLEFRVAQAEKLPFEDHSVDVLTSAQSWHWVDTDRAGAEVRRVLKHPGCCVLYGYTRPRLVNENAEALVERHYSNTLGSYWHPRRFLVDEKFASLGTPYPVVERQELSEVVTIKLSHFFGYLDTWSAYHKYCETHPGNTVLADLKNEVQQCLNCATDIDLDVQMLYFIIFCLSSSKH